MADQDHNGYRIISDVIRGLSTDKLAAGDRQSPLISIRAIFRRTVDGLRVAACYSRCLREQGYKADIHSVNKDENGIASGIVLKSGPLPERIAYELAECMQAKDSPDPIAKRLNIHFRMKD